jgi:hypothetical protein
MRLLVLANDGVPFVPHAIPTGESAEMGGEWKSTKNFQTAATREIARQRAAPPTPLSSNRTGLFDRTFRSRDRAIAEGDDDGGGETPDDMCVLDTAIATAPTRGETKDFDLSERVLPSWLSSVLRGEDDGTMDAVEGRHRSSPPTIGQEMVHQNMML